MVKLPLTAACIVCFLSYTPGKHQYLSFLSVIQWENAGGLARSDEVGRVYAAAQTFSTTGNYFPSHLTYFIFLPEEAVAVEL